MLLCVVVMVRAPERYNLLRTRYYDWHDVPVFILLIQLAHI